MSNNPNPNDLPPSGDEFADLIRRLSINNENVFRCLAQEKLEKSVWFMSYLCATKEKEEVDRKLKDSHVLIHTLIEYLRDTRDELHTLTRQVASMHLETRQYEDALANSHRIYSAIADALRRNE
ncbi:hypothetical protein QR680_002789 [Steinernema hermaphroditum]|uniref:Uncharacterized protein n=1 Tax=Steinernema hermaphroditum TaxID=289476 RepID=A0AA39LJ21_9BILA|nr:hypothetical protein QR680_002789 [Steinernema hermaphroditum]